MGELKVALARHVPERTLNGLTADERRLHLNSRA
jgi:hypothetical protein